LQVLDACLTELENANERGEQTLSPGLAAKLRPHIGGVAPGMRMYEALDLVFRHQETYLNSREEGTHLQRRRRAVCDVVRLVDSSQSGASLSEGEARTLTEAIKGHVKNLYLLMLEAHSGRAWVALGYKTWEAYVRAEFGLSRSRSYELLIQARVVQTIRGAAGMSGVPDISTHLAMRLQPYLGELVESIQSAATHGWSEQKAREGVAQAISRQRAAMREVQNRATAVAAWDRTPSTDRGPSLVADEKPWTDRNDARIRLREAIEFLTSLPPAHELFESIGPRETRRVADIKRAAEWLRDFAELCADAGRPLDGHAHVAVINGSVANHSAASLDSRHVRSYPPVSIDASSV
jgi:hypothetical protein